MVPQRCPTPDNSSNTAGTNCLDLLTQNRVASPNATATVRPRDCNKRDISAKNRPKNQFQQQRGFFKRVPSHFLTWVKSTQFTRETTRNIILKQIAWAENAVFSRHGACATNLRLRVGEEETATATGRTCPTCVFELRIPHATSTTAKKHAAGSCLLGFLNKN